MQPKFSIVVPTYNHCEDLLKPCIESIERYTDMENVEVIVVANGCTDGTLAYLSHEAIRSPWLKYLWIDEPAGYTRATNEGIKVARGEYVVLLNNDTVLLEQPKNRWLELMEAPFAKKSVGLAGPLQLHDDYSNADVLIFFCVMIRREVFDTIGVLDEVFSPGGGEDIDFTIRAQRAGYEAACVTQSSYNGETNVGDFPIWHKNNQTFVEIPEYTRSIVKRNGLINCKRYNTDVRLNLGSGGMRIARHLSVDLHDSRADIHMDCTRLDFPNNSVSQIVASHLFEHLNPYHAATILQEWLRVLKPGGRLVMEMPNIESLCARFAGASKAERYGILNAVYGSVNTTGEGGPDNITSPHLFGWWPEALWDHLVGCGYIGVVFGDEQFPHPESNLRVEAVKPLPHRAQLKQDQPFLYKEIFEENSYRVLDQEVRDKVVLDIGANVGMFALYCVEHGAKQVIAVEAQQTIFRTGLMPVAAAYQQILPYLCAVHSRSNETVRLENYHVGSRISPTGEAVTTTTLADLVCLHPDAEVLKLDCEGSEFDILLSTPDRILAGFKVIYIEIHGYINPNPAYRDPEDVRARLRGAYFVQVHQQKIAGDPSITDPRVPASVFVEKWVRA